MFRLSGPLLARLSSVLAMKVLPQETTLHSYLHAALKGIALVVAGSVLLGGAISAGLYMLFDQLIANGYSKVNVLTIVMGTAILLGLLCYYMANKWLNETFGPKPQKRSIIDEKLDYVRDLACESATGFIEGFLSSKNNKPKRPNNMVDIRTAKRKR